MRTGFTQFGEDCEWKLADTHHSADKGTLIHCSPGLLWIVQDNNQLSFNQGDLGQLLRKNSNHK